MEHQDDGDEGCCSLTYNDYRVQSTENKAYYLRHQQRMFYLMYYIQILLYSLVIPSLPIPPVPLTFPSFSEGPRGLLEALNILPASSISCFCPSPLAYSTGKGVLQHRPLFFCGSSPLAMLAVVRRICACVHLEKPTTVWCDYHIWHVPSPLISLLWTPSPRSPMEFPLSCSPGHWFLSIPTKIRFSLYLFYS